MASLFGLFGKKKTDAAESGVSNQNNGSQPQAFFLDADEAKTFGNIDYMRTPKTVKRTFPKTAGNGGEFEQVVQISAMGAMSLEEAKVALNGSSLNGSTANGAVLNESALNGSSANGAASAESSTIEVSDRRSTDTSMDMFRSMARNLRKR